MKTLFVTSSGTGIGKTLVTAALCHQLRQAGTRVRALKPVISGFDADTQAESDTAIILDSLGLPLTPETVEPVSPWRFAAPLSPDMAAVREGRALDFDAIVRFCREAATGPEEVLLIEGVGGRIVEACFVVDLPELGGSRRLEELGYPTFALCSFEGR